MTLDRLRIDDGRHLVRLVVDEDATHAAREPRYRVSCSCGRMPTYAPATRDDALAAHVGHVGVRLGPSKGPRWMPLGARIALLVLAMGVLFGGCYLAGQALIDHHALVDGQARLVRLGATLAGWTFAFGFMVAVRRYIAPTRA